MCLEANSTVEDLQMQLSTAKAERDYAGSDAESLRSLLGLSEEHATKLQAGGDDLYRANVEYESELKSQQNIMALSEGRIHSHLQEESRKVAELANINSNHVSTIRKMQAGYQTILSTEANLAKTSKRPMIWRRNFERKWRPLTISPIKLMYKLHKHRIGWR